MTDGHRSHDGQTPAPGVDDKDDMLLKGEDQTSREHPDDEVIAGYLDDRLDPEARRAVEAHLATCDDCRTLLAESVRVLEELDAVAPASGAVADADDAADTDADAERRTQPGEPSRVLPFVRPTARKLLVFAALLTAAALVFAIVRAPGPIGRMLNGEVGYTTVAGRRALIDAVREHRTFEPRLVGFQYAPVQGVMRSGAPTQTISPEVTLATARIALLAEREPSPDTRALLGVADLVTGETSAAIKALEDASRSRPDDARMLSDLSAAYYVRAEREGRKEDYTQALDTARRAVDLYPTLPEARFNLALATEQAASAADARSAWNAYLQLDPTSPWATEARRHLTDLPK